MHIMYFYSNYLAWKCINVSPSSAVTGTGYNKTAMISLNINILFLPENVSRVRLKPDGTRWRKGGEVKGRLENGVGSQYSHTTSERGVSSITNADAHTSAASSRLNWRPRRFKWIRPFRRKTKSGFCACAITFQTHYILFVHRMGLLSTPWINNHFIIIPLLTEPRKAE